MNDRDRKHCKDLLSLLALAVLAGILFFAFGAKCHAQVVSGVWYKLSPESNVEYRRVGVAEEFRDLTTGFSAAWNGTTGDLGGYASGTGRMQELGTIARGAPTRLSAFMSGFYPSAAVPVPVIQKNWSVDTKHYTNGTGGAQRGYADRLQWIALRGTVTQQQAAINTLAAWCTDELHRPWSQVPWTYAKLDTWAASGRGPGSKVAGWNRGDVAHASFTEPGAAAALRLPIGTMTAWMSWRTLYGDTSRTGQYFMSAPREAWLLQRTVEAELLGFGEGSPELLKSFFGDVKPRTYLASRVDQMIREWWERSPKDKASSGDRTDSKVLPQISDPESNEIAGYYTWQRGIVLWCCRYTLESHLLDPALQQRLEAFLTEIEAWNLTWFHAQKGIPYSAGTTIFPTDAGAMAIISQANAGEIARWWEATPLFLHPVPGGVNIITRYRVDILDLFAAPYAFSAQGAAFTELAAKTFKASDSEQYLAPMWARLGR